MTIFRAWNTSKYQDAAAFSEGRDINTHRRFVVKCDEVLGRYYMTYPSCQKHSVLLIFKVCMSGVWEMNAKEARLVIRRLWSLFSLWHGGREDYLVYTKKQGSVDKERSWKLNCGDSVLRTRGNNTRCWALLALFVKHQPLPLQGFVH